MVFPQGAAVLGRHSINTLSRVNTTQQGASFFFPFYCKTRQEKSIYYTKLFVAVNFSLKKSANSYYSRPMARSLKHLGYSNFLTIFSIIRFDLNVFFCHNSSQPIIGLEGTNEKEL